MAPTLWGLLAITQVLLLLRFCIAQSSGFAPAALPHALRSPYVNAWIDVSNKGNPLTQWPVDVGFDGHIFGMAIFLRVDGSTYGLLGDTGPLTSAAPTLKGSLVTPTRTVIMSDCGPLSVNLTILSPIETSDLVLQSLPFSYIYIDVTVNDGKSHTVQAYIDASGEWVSGDLTNVIHWNTTNSDAGVVFHEVQRFPFDSMVQSSGGVTEDGVLYMASLKGDGITWQSGNNTDFRQKWIANPVLNETTETPFRPIGTDFPLFGLAADLGTISTNPKSPLVLWGMGVVRDPSILYAIGSDQQQRNSLFWSRWSRIDDAINSFLSGFSGAKQRAINLDNKIFGDANAFSDNYADLVALSSRMAVGNTEITTSKNGNAFNTSDIMIFTRDTGSSQRANPVEVLYANFPSILYLNASWTSYLLEPLLRTQQANSNGKNFAIPDLGSVFPKALGNSDAQNFRSVEDSGSMIIMAWLTTRYTGDTSQVSRYYSLLKTWADQLATNSLTPSGFSDADGLQNANMTNLAIKGILGIRAFAEIANAIGQGSDYSSYKDSATSLANSWTKFASASDHLTSTYNSGNSWAMIYNLYADKLMGTQLVADSVYSMQDKWYASKASTSDSFGLPYDSNVAAVKSHWMMFTAASIGNSQTRNQWIDMVHSRYAANNLAGTVPTSYDSKNGSATTTSPGKGSPAHGAMFALLALGISPTLGNKDKGAKSSRNLAGAIAGGVVGGLAVVCIIIFAFFLWRRRRREAGVGEYNSSESKGGYFAGRRKDRPSSILADMNPVSPSNGEATGNHIPMQMATATPYLYTPLTETGTRDTSTPNLSSLTPQSTPYDARSTVSAPLTASTDPSSTGNRAQAPPLPRKRPLVVANDHQRTPSQTLSDGGSSHAAATEHLRNEVETLRREMDELRQRNEAPPEYTD